MPKAPVVLTALTAALIIPFISLPEITHASQTNTRLDAWGTLELAGSGWLSNGGVDVYSNGSSADSHTPIANNTVNGVTSGEEWQCVEMIDRLYLTKGWITATWSGNGNTIANNVPSGLTKENNGAISSLSTGDVLTLDGGPAGLGHAFIVNSVGGTIQLVSQNSIAVYNSASVASGTSFANNNAQINMSGWATYTTQAVVHHPAGGGGGGGTNGGDLHGFIAANSEIDAKAARGFGGWTQEVGPGNASKFAIGDTYQMFLRGDGTVFARSGGVGTTWTQETSANSATAIAISSTGMQLMLEPSGAVDSKTSISCGGWNQEVGPGNASKIAVGGNTMMFLRGDQAAFAKTGQSGSWVQVTGTVSTAAIAVSSTTLLAIIGTDNAIYSQQGVTPSNWFQEVGPGNASSMSLASSSTTGNTMMFIRGDGAVFAKTVSGQGGSWVQETNPSSATAVAAGADGIQVMLVVNGEVDTRPNTTGGLTGWTAETSASSATAIAASQ